MRKQKVLTPEQQEEIRTKDFFDMILPSTVKFMSDHYIVGDSYRCVWVIREYPPSTEETLQEVCFGIHSMCVGAESVYFNGHTNITDDAFLVFGVKGLMDTNKRLKDTMLFNILSYMSNQLLGVGNTAASIDELYLFLTNMTAIEYIRNAMKRVRKKESSIILASQNIEDFLIPEIREFTKPLFSIPTHQFLFNAGQINPKEYMDALLTNPKVLKTIGGKMLYQLYPPHKDNVGYKSRITDMRENLLEVLQVYKKDEILTESEQMNLVKRVMQLSVDCLRFYMYAENKIQEQREGESACQISQVSS